MKKGSDSNTGAYSSAVWHVQAGRSRVQRKVVADGFRTEYPYAGVVVVAENHSPEDDESASIAVETIRDVFAEGVAFGVDDALEDSFQEASELIREKQLAGCSAAAVAFSATHIWYALAGNCRIYRIDSDGVRCIVQDRTRAAELNMAMNHPDYLKTVRDMEWWLGVAGQGKPVCGHTRLRRDTTYLLMTAGSWIQFEQTKPVLHRKGARRTINGWITSLSRDLKLAYRRQGGAMAAVSGASARDGGSVSWRSIGIAAVSIALAGYLVFGNPLSCREEESLRTDLFAPDTVAEEIVRPLFPDTGATTTDSASVGMIAALGDSLAASLEPPVPDISSELPLQTAVIGGTDIPMPPDSFAVSVNTGPDLQWENFSPGIYSLAGDTASGILASRASLLFPALEIIELQRIVTVRENGVADSARWLASLPPEEAGTTGVIVETRSSVAGGASWIRNYPVFANGDRDNRSGDPGGFAGDALEDMPVLPDTGTYRLIIVL